MQPDADAGIHGHSVYCPLPLLALINCLILLAFSRLVLNPHFLSASSKSVGRYATAILRSWIARERSVVDEPVEQGRCPGKWRRNMKRLQKKSSSTMIACHHQPTPECPLMEMPVECSNSSSHSLDWVLYGGNPGVLWTNKGKGNGHQTWEGKEKVIAQSSGWIRAASSLYLPTSWAHRLSVDAVGKPRTR